MGNDYLYIQIIDHILKKIADGTINSSSRIPTELELSEQFNVSRITSKKALDELAKKGIIVRHRRLGSFINDSYNPVTGEFNSPTAVSPENSGIAKPKNLIGLVLPIGTNMGDMMLYVNGILDYLTPRGYYLIISNSNRDSLKEKEIITNFIKDNFCGIIYYPFSDRHNYSLMTMLSIDKYPIVLIDKFFSGIDIPYVIPDSFSGAKTITEYLIKCGHKRIAFFSETEISEFSTIRERFSGYCDALKSNNIPIDESLIFENILKSKEDSTEQYIVGLYNPIKDAMAKNATAIFCPADGIAINVISACNELNISVPDNLSITGFDDLMGTNQYPVPLTTVRQDLYELGHEAAKILVKNIEGKVYKHKYIYPVKLVVRSSVKVIN